MNQLLKKCKIIVLNYINSTELRHERIPRIFHVFFIFNAVDVAGRDRDFDRDDIGSGDDWETFSSSEI